MSQGVEVPLRGQEQSQGMDSGSFQMSQFFMSGGQSIGVSMWSPSFCDCHPGDTTRLPGSRGH